MTTEVSSVFNIRFVNSSLTVWKNATVTAIDLSYPKSDTYAEFPDASEIERYAPYSSIPMRWNTPCRYSPSGRYSSDVLVLSSSIAEKMSLSARILETYEDRSSLVSHEDGITRGALRERVYAVPVDIIDRSKLEAEVFADAEPQYLIRVKCVGEKCFQAEFKYTTDPLKTIE